MFSGGNRTQAPIFHAQDQELRIRPYNAALTAFTKKVCTELGLTDSDVCLFETRTAFDCVLRQKVQKMGTVTDNLGHCSHHISNMKANIETAIPVKTDFTRVLDNYVEELNYMRKSFV